jgi:hypothetical protein
LSENVAEKKGDNKFVLEQPKYPAKDGKPSEATFFYKKKQ